MTAERSLCSPRANNCFFTTSNSRTIPSIASNARPNAQVEAGYGLKPEPPAQSVASKPQFPSSPLRVGRFYAAPVFRRFPKTRHRRRPLPRRLLSLLDLPRARRATLDQLVSRLRLRLLQSLMPNVVAIIHPFKMDLRQRFIGTGQRFFERVAACRHAQDSPAAGH